ncbi:MAG: hypothetical protein IPL78_08295 [Chloroflexi bacterium]|nr:hypothetical protein [Chloroflexota bacterium]
MQDGGHLLGGLRPDNHFGQAGGLVGLVFVAELALGGGGAQPSGPTMAANWVNISGVTG